MLPLHRSSGWAYLVAVAGAGLVAAARIVPDGSGRSFLASLAFVAAVLAAGMVGGWKPGMVTTGLCAASAVLFLLSRDFNLRVSIGDLLRVAAFVVVGVAISYLSERVRAASQHAEDRQRQLEQEIAQRRRDDRQKDEFLATLAHELRNPLAPLANALELIRLAGDEPAAVEEARTTMQRQLRQMVRLVDDLLDLSRITRGTIELRRERLDLADILEGALETSRPLIDGAGHELSISLPSEPIYVDGDLTRLAQVFSNLLNNAAKYTDRGGRIGLVVGREGGREGGRVVVSVRDNGIGIPASMLANVFEMFRQVDGSLEKAHGGLGIGLTIVKRLIEMHGGTVEARSDGVDRGSEFVVRLPIVPAPQCERARPSTDGVAHTAVAPRRILVVDDNRDSASSLATMLRRLGNDTRVAFDGLEALDTATDYRPEIILLDIGMPKLSGYDVCRQIRKEPWGNDVLMVAVTGWGQEQDRRSSREAGFNHHLVKPVDLSVLQKVLAEPVPY